MHDKAQLLSVSPPLTTRDVDVVGLLMWLGCVVVFCCAVVVLGFVFFGTRCLFFFFLCSFALPCLALPCLALPCLALSCFALSCLRRRLHPSHETRPGTCWLIQALLWSTWTSLWPCCQACSGVTCSSFIRMPLKLLRAMNTVAMTAATASCWRSRGCVSCRSASG